MDRPQGDSNSEADRPAAARGNGPGYEDEIDLLDYVEVIVRRRWLILFGTVICAVATFGYGKVQPVSLDFHGAELG